METSLRLTVRFLLILLAILVVQQSLQAQMSLSWYKETPALESHAYRAIASDVSGRCFYISDSQTHCIYVFLVAHPDAPVMTITDPTWANSTFGPYGMDFASDGNLYIAVWKNEAANGPPDNSLWRYGTCSRQLTQLCTLSDDPRSLKVVGSGMHTLVYISGTYGNVIRCHPVTWNHFVSEIMFTTGIFANQQCVIADRGQRTLFVSSWTSSYGTTPYRTPVTKWNAVGTRDVSFAVNFLSEGDVPGMEMGMDDNLFYLFHISLPPVTGARIYSVNTRTGLKIDEVLVGPSGLYAGGNICLSSRGEMFFARTLDLRNGLFISAYGVVSIRKDRCKPGECSGPEFTSNGDLDLQNYPNPCNPSTTIRYNLPQNSEVTLAVYNTLGQQVSLLVQGEQEAGYHEVRFDGSNIASGVYFYRLQAGSLVESKKVLLLR